MLHDELFDVESTWMGDGKRPDWKQIDRGLRELATRRGALDLEEAQLLCVAVRIEVWRELGKATLLEYLEEVLGYGPRAAQDRVRVALALDDLPVLADALACGELSYSAIRELTRVATPITQTEWRDEARGKNLRQIEDIVAGRKKGDGPRDPVDPDLRPRGLYFEVRPATLALLRQAQQVLAGERGMQLDDDALIAALCNAVLGGGGSEDDSGRAKYQVMTLLCESCKQGWVDAGGRRFAIEPADVERAECDAQWIGSIDAPAARATQDVSPTTQRFVRRRDGGRCCVPGCRAARHLEIHHVVPRAAGGDHTPENLTLLCDGHHVALHEGKLTITGKAPKLDIRMIKHAHLGAVESAEVDRSRETPAAKLERVARMVEVKHALVDLGYTRTEARAAVETVMARTRATTIDQLLVEALQACRKLHG